MGTGPQQVPLHALLLIQRPELHALAEDTVPGMSVMPECPQCIYVAVLLTWGDYAPRDM